MGKTSTAIALFLAALLGPGCSADSALNSGKGSGGSASGGQTAGGSGGTGPCLPVACPAIACVGGTYTPNPDPCGCPICGPAKDAGSDTASTACAGLDECTCGAVNGCALIAEPCYCPFPLCNSAGACFCGGGRFVACAPVAIATCQGAKGRVSALCPTLSGPTYDGVCAMPVPECVTKCLGEVSSCSDVSCAFCEACDCAADRFSTCYGTCRTALGR